MFQRVCAALERQGCREDWVVDSDVDIDIGVRVTGSSKILVYILELSIEIKFVMPIHRPTPECSKYAVSLVVKHLVTGKIDEELSFYVVCERCVQL